MSWRPFGSLLLRPYSIDLRERAVALYEKLGVYLQVARRLLVHPTRVKNRVEKKRLTGSLENEWARRGRHACLDEPGRLGLRQRLDEENDLALAVMLDRLRPRGYRCCRATVANALAAMGMTCPKNGPFQNLRSFVERLLPDVEEQVVDVAHSA